MRLAQQSMLCSKEKGVCEGFTKRVGHFESGGHTDCLEFQGIAGMMGTRGTKLAAVE